ncbi:histidine phosphatase family protein [Falsibacillus albus]|uniref:Histidine phosphatase family protein n=1 Tax=Falsibacillus albus TaxID=2478915 RepID=A0A3L7JU40_9BACI|nr:histidine phosphatase family protein [Falsibacillus albus]RLQ94246.1 histidine phosphatase family protein [Falsibacillus albus]
MFRLFITRHGQTVWNTEERMQGWKDSALTQNGIDHALSLGQRLKDISFQAVYASPSGRTARTAELICKGRKTLITYDDDLREMNMGDWEGKTKTHITENFAVDYHSFGSTPHLFKSANGENFSDLRKRVSRFLERVKMEQSAGDILVVTHTITIKSLLAIVKGLPIEQVWGTTFIHDTSLSIVEIDVENDEICVVMEGDVAHKKNLNRV